MLSEDPTADLSQKEAIGTKDGNIPQTYSKLG